MNAFFRKISVFFLVALCHCNVDLSGFTNPPDGDNSATTKDGGTYTPTDGGTTNLCEQDNEDDCVDANDPDDIVYFGDDEFDFGFSEVGDVECLTLAMPAGMVYQAEIDKTESADGTPTTSQDSDGNFIFAPVDTSGEPTQDRTAVASGDLKICYLRTETGSHSGSILASFRKESSEDWQYLVTIRVSGSTGETPFFVIDSPSDGAIYDKRDGHNDGLDNTEGDLFVNAVGRVSSEYWDILENGLSTPIQIVSDTLPYTANLESDGSFAQTIALPQVPGIYSVDFSADTMRGTTITKTQTVIVADKPNLEILVKDSNGDDVETAVPTDLQNLIVGLRISNLEVAGPNQDELPVTLYDVYFDDLLVATDLTLWNDEEVSWCSKDSDRPAAVGNDYAGFNTVNTYCLPLSELTNINTGSHTLTAKAKNALGEATTTFTIIADYSKPTFTIKTPEESQLYSSNTKKIRIQGVVQNFAGYKVADAPESVDGDTGAYCLPSTTSACADSNIKLWFNQNTAEDPILLYPQYAEDYQNKTQKEINDLVSAATPDQCRDFTESTSHFSGSTQDTVIGNDGSITTTLASKDSDGNETTTVYTTATDGTITVDVDGTTTTIFSYSETETTTLTISTDENGGIITTVYDSSDDSTTTYTTDGRTGKISQTTSRFECNIPSATFDITLNSDQVDLNLFTNILEFRAESVASHRSIEVRTFQLGYTVPHKLSDSIFGAGKGLQNLTSGDLGTIKSRCDDFDCVKRSPLMLYLSEGTLKKQTDEGAKIATAIENILNENFPFENLANGWPLPKNDNDGDGDTSNDPIDLEATYKKQFHYPRDGVPNMDYLQDDEMKTIIYQGIHKSAMAEKLFALQNLITYKTIKGIEESGTAFNDSECNIYNNHLCFFEKEGDPLDELDKSYNVAVDACGQTITSAFVPLQDFQYIVWSKELIYTDPSWPGEIAGTNLDFNDFESGKWVVDRDSIELKPNGRIDVKVCVLPNEDRYSDCSDDVSDADRPALKGTFIQHNLIKGGLLGNYGIDDFAVPMRWNVGKIILDLKDLCIGPASICDPKNTDYDASVKNNILNIDKNKIENVDINIMNPEESIDSISLIPFKKCRQLYKDDWVKNRKAINASEGTNWSTEIEEDNYPLGCPPEDSADAVFPVLIENNSFTSEVVGTWLANLRENHPEDASTTWILHMIWAGVEDTFAKIVPCLDTEAVIPVFGVKNERFASAKSYSLPPSPGKSITKLDSLFTDNKGTYPPYVYDGNQISTNLKWKSLNANLNIKQSDIIVDEHGLTARLSLNAGVDNVKMNSSPESENEIAFFKGHLTRSNSQGDLGDYPLQAEESDDAYFSATIDVEEIFNAASYLIFKKGPLSLVDMLGVEDIESNGVDTATINAKVLGDFDICGDIAGTLNTTLPTTLFFGPASSPFETSAMSVDLILDKDHPATLTLDAIDISDLADEDAVTAGHAAEIKIGLTNVQASFKNFEEVGDNTFKIGEEVYRLRLDAVLNLVAIYHPDQRKIHLFFPQNQNYHLSVVPGHNAGVYDDATIVSALNGLFGTIFAKFEKNVAYTTDDSQATAAITLKGAKNGYTGDSDTSKIAIEALGGKLDFDFNIDAPPNGECADGEAPQYADTDSSRRRHSNNPDESDERLGDGAQKAGMPVSGEILKPSVIKSEDANLLDEICNPFEESPFYNPIDAALCEFDIDSVLMKPTLIFHEGHLSVGGKIEIDLMDWAQ